VTLKESLLWPLSLPYAAIAHLRARAYRKGILRQRHLDGVVISVGNLTVGGTGKTPMVLWIAERLIAEGKSIGILTRGYRGNTVSASSDKSQTTNDSAALSTSDEVQLLQSRLQNRALFGVGADRYKNGVALAARGIDWFILDDGFQHFHLARNVDVVLVDASKPFGGGHLLPAGRLREPRTALGRADLIVITRSTHAPAVESVLRRYSDAPLFYARTELSSIYSRSQRDLAIAEARAKSLFAFCGIGNPTAFVSDLRDWGFQIAGYKSFPDHHRYSPADIEAIEKEARKSGATSLICTEKDRFNLDKAAPSMDLLICAISLRVDQQEDFWSALMEKTKSATANAYRG
jgi:tetraacyldisaccharide 4'-kinase